MALVFLFLFSFIFIQALLICSSRQLSMGTPSFGTLRSTPTTSFKCIDSEQSIPFHCHSCIMIPIMSNIRNTSRSYLLPLLSVSLQFIVQILLIDIYALEGTLITCETFPVT